MDEPAPTQLRLSPLHSRHEALGAKLAAFAGWQMPLEYPGGTLREHAAVREAAGVFDVSHMGKVRLVGAGAKDFANSVLTNDLGRIGPGKAQYTLLCDDTGGVVDDLIAYLVGPDYLMRSGPRGFYENRDLYFAELKDAGASDEEIAAIQRYGSPVLH